MTPPLRWLYHVRSSQTVTTPGERYAPASLGREGFVHASFRDDVLESARLYFEDTSTLEVLQIDPRRLDGDVELAQTPRGEMPHIRGAIPDDAVRAVRPLTEHVSDSVPDQVTGTRCMFVAFKGMTLLDLVGVYDPLSRIRSMGFDETCACEIVAAHPGEGWAADRAMLVVERVRPPLEEVDLLILPGGPASRQLTADGPFMAWLASYPSNRLIASVCTGALLLGAAGRLQGKRATTHASAMSDLLLYGAVATVDRVVDEGQVVTAAGVTSGIDLGLHLVRRLAGDDVAAKVARQMEVPT
jgi:cyclohexyl-isocyanide hydratase